MNILQVGGKTRQSNLELLRILSMFLVLLIHYTQSIEINPETVKFNPLFYFVNTELKSLSFVCVNCFVIISGYFGIKWKTKSFLGLLYQVFFWLFIGIVIAKIFEFHIEDNILNVFFHFFKIRWFISAYIGLYILSPLINAFIEKVSEKELLRYIIVFYTFSTLIGYLFLSDEFNEGMSLISLIGLYLIGSYIRVSKLTIFNFVPLTNLLIYFGLSFILASFHFGFLWVGFSKSPFGYLNPIVILMSIYLFLFFQKINIGTVKWINWVAGSVLAVYLFHMHSFLQPVYFKCCNFITEQGWMSFLWLPLFFISIFIFCVIIDKIREESFRYMVKLTDYLKNKFLLYNINYKNKVFISFFMKKN